MTTPRETLEAQTANLKNERASAPSTGNSFGFGNLPRAKSGLFDSAWEDRLKTTTPAPTSTPSFVFGTPTPAPLFPTLAPGALSAAATPTRKNERPAKRTRLDYEEYITVLVGATEKRYVVYKQIICQASEFIQHACNGEGKDGTEGIVKLPEAKPPAFGVYLCWLYTGEIDAVTPSTNTKSPTTSSDKDILPYLATTRLLFDAFALGELLQNAVFTNAVVDEFISHFKRANTVPGGCKAVSCLWDVVPAQSSIMRALVDFVAAGTAEGSNFVQRIDEYPAGFVAEIAKAGIRDRGLALIERGPFNRNRCFYHDHEGGKGRTKSCA